VFGIWLAQGIANGPNADPGGKILHQLEVASQALPNDAQISFRSDGEPKWDSCDGRPGTFGWTDVTVRISFRSRSANALVIAHADKSLHQMGWISDYSNAVNGGTQIGWNRVLDNGSVAIVQLTRAARYPGGPQPAEWELDAVAPPVGPRASGC
jgi:hypothetical protein